MRIGVMLGGGGERLDPGELAARAISTIA